MAGVTAGGPVGPGLADIGDHRGDLLVVQFILPDGHLAQAALAAIEDGGNHRLGVTQDKGVFIQGRKGGREPLAIGAMALGAIVLKDRLAPLDGVALTLGQSDAAQQTQAKQKNQVFHGVALICPWSYPASTSAGCRRDL